MTRRDLSLDFCRVIAMTGVLCIHVTSAYIHRESGVTLLGMNLAFFLNQAARFSVPFFLLLSGLSLGQRRQAPEPLAFWAARLGKLGPPYLFWCAFYALWHCGFRWEEARLLYGAPAALLRLFLTGASAPHLYFMGILFQLYLLYPLLAPRVRRAPFPSVLYSMPSG